MEQLRGFFCQSVCGFPLHIQLLYSRVHCVGPHSPLRDERCRDQFASWHNQRDVTTGARFTLTWNCFWVKVEDMWLNRIAAHLVKIDPLWWLVDKAVWLTTSVSLGFCWLLFSRYHQIQPFGHVCVYTHNRQFKHQTLTQTQTLISREFSQLNIWKADLHCTQMLRQAV